MRRASRVGFVVFGLFVLVVGGFSLAWACGGQPTISLDPSTGTVGSSVSVSGASFREGPVEIHWNSVSGPLIGMGQGPNFASVVEVPEASPGVYYVVAVQQSSGTATQSFTVTSSTSQPPPESNTGGGEQGSGRERTSGSTSGATRSDQEQGSDQGSGPQGPGPEAPAPASQQPSVVTAGGREVFGGSVPTLANSPRQDKGRAERGVDAIPTTAPYGSPEFTTGLDRVPVGLWSGLDSPSVLPSPLDSQLTGAGASSSLLLVGVGLLAVGLVALFTGFLVADVRRRRALAQGGDRTRE